jgi:hypothetical protein
MLLVFLMLFIYIGFVLFNHIYYCVLIVLSAMLITSAD